MIQGGEISVPTQYLKIILALLVQSDQRNLMGAMILMTEWSFWVPGMATTGVMQRNNSVWVATAVDFAWVQI